MINATSGFRKEIDSLGEVCVSADKLWGAQTQRSLEHFSIGKDLIPREMILAYAVLEKAAVNLQGIPPARSHFPAVHAVRDLGRFG
jgi:fumarate hydratase class II